MTLEQVLKHIQNLNTKEVVRIERDRKEKDMFWYSLKGSERDVSHIRLREIKN